MTQVETINKSVPFNDARPGIVASRSDHMAINLLPFFMKQLISSLKVYDINEIELYLSSVNFLSCSETKQLQELPSKQQRLNFIASLLDCDPERCPPFSKAVNDFIGNAFAQTSSACRSVEQCFKAKPPKHVVRGMAIENETKETTAGMQTDFGMNSTTNSTTVSQKMSFPSSGREFTRLLGEGSDLSFCDEQTGTNERIPVGQSQEVFGSENSFCSVSSHGTHYDNGRQTLPDTDSDYKTMTTVVPESTFTATPTSNTPNSKCRNYPLPPEYHQKVLSSNHTSKKPIRHHQRAVFQSSSTHGNPARDLEQRHKCMARRDVHIHTNCNFNFNFNGNENSNPLQNFPLSTLTQMGLNMVPPASCVLSSNDQDEQLTSVYQDMRSSMANVKILEEHSVQFIQYMDVPSLLPHLRKHHLLTTSEFEKLDNECISRKRNSMLISLIPNKGKYGLEKFLQCLKSEKEHAGHAELAELIEKSLEKLMPSSSV